VAPTGIASHPNGRRVGELAVVLGTPSGRGRRGADSSTAVSTAPAQSAYGPAGFREGGARLGWSDATKFCASIPGDGGVGGRRPGGPRRGLFETVCSGTRYRPGPRGSPVGTAGGRPGAGWPPGTDQPGRAEAALHRAARRNASWTGCRNPSRPGLARSGCRGGSLARGDQEGHTVTPS